MVELAATVSMRRDRRRTNLHSVGDSITNNLYAVQGVNTANGYGSYSAKGIQFWANAILGFPLNIVGSDGYSGYSTGQLLPMLSTWLAIDAHIEHVLMGTNDPSGGTNATVLAAGDISRPGTTIYNIYTICEAFLNANRLVLLGTIMPSNFTVGVANNARRAHLNTVNRWIRDYAKTTPGVLLVDYARVMTNTNPADTTALYSGGSAIAAGGGGPLTTVTEDGLHPSNNGAMVNGMELARVLAPYVGPVDVAAAIPVDHYNYATNPLMQGNNASGSAGFLHENAAVTGNGPDGLVTHRTATGTGATQKVARADARYGDSLFQVAATAAADWDGVNFTTGSDDVSATGRYDQGWTATTAFTVGSRKKPTVANGYIYKVAVGGTTGGSEPTWPTTEGAMVLDGTVIWMCQQMPQAGDQFYGIMEAQVVGLTAAKWAQLSLYLYAIDTTGATIGSAYGPVGYVSGSIPGISVWPSTPMILRTPLITLGAGTIRHFVLTARQRMQTGATFTVNFGRAGIMRAS